MPHFADILRRFQCLFTVRVLHAVLRETLLQLGVGAVAEHKRQLCLRNALKAGKVRKNSSNDNGKHADGACRVKENEDGSVEEEEEEEAEDVGEDQEMEEMGGEGIEGLPPVEVVEDNGLEQMDIDEEDPALPRPQKAPPLGCYVWRPCMQLSDTLHPSRLQGPCGLEVLQCGLFLAVLHQLPPSLSL